MEIRCTNKKCLHEWNYKGSLSDGKDYVTCSICRYKSMLKKAISGKKDVPFPSKFTNKSTDLLTDSLTYSKEKPQTEEEEEYDEELDEDKFEEQEELFQEPKRKLCSKHNLPANYNNYNKKWLCEECIKSEIKKNITNKKYKEVTSHLRTVSEIKSDLEIKQIPFSIPIK